MYFSSSSRMVRFSSLRSIPVTTQVQESMHMYSRRFLTDGDTQLLGVVRNTLHTDR